MFHLVDGTDAFWFSLPAHILFPQRTTQFAYSLDAAILLLLLIAHTRSSKSKTAPEPGAALKTSPATADHTPEYNDKDVERVVAANAWDAEWVELEPVKPTTKRMSRAVVPASASPAKLLAPPTVLDADEQLVSDSIYDRAGPVSPAQKLVLHLIAGFATGLLPLLQVRATAGLCHRSHAR